MRPPQHISPQPPISRLSAYWAAVTSADFCPMKQKNLFPSVRRESPLSGCRASGVIGTAFIGQPKASPPRASETSQSKVSGHKLKASWPLCRSLLELAPDPSASVIAIWSCGLVCLNMVLSLSVSGPVATVSQILHSPASGSLNPSRNAIWLYKYALWCLHNNG